MTTTEAARYLGLKPSYLYKMMMRRAIPYYKPGGKLCFFAKEDLDAWMKRVRVKSQEEIDSEAARYLAAHEKTNDLPIFYKTTVMDNFKDMEPGIKDTAAFDSTNKESKKKESRPVISAKAQTILEFLRNCTPFMKPIPSVEWLATAREKVTSARLKRPICWQSTVSSITGLPKKMVRAARLS